MEYEKLSYPEAIEKLAASVNITEFERLLNKLLILGSICDLLPALKLKKSTA
jgi:hypothetical protein